MQRGLRSRSGYESGFHGSVQLATHVDMISASVIVQNHVPQKRKETQAHRMVIASPSQHEHGLLLTENRKETMVKKLVGTGSMRTMMLR
ncbi:hypothetical protein DFR42_11578 [Undibacterium pigrum]|uniref:Uncharacterized protein n=1 Tax=Undibacterium pigrum TaxID=401470 RepID=A0A318J1L0_9BURK|nr:hypothetical protein DFR42_11578 [Undibacterium pigrum]